MRVAFRGLRERQCGPSIARLGSMALGDVVVVVATAAAAAATATAAPTVATFVHHRASSTISSNSRNQEQYQQQRLSPCDRRHASRETANNISCVSRKQRSYSLRLQKRKDGRMEQRFDTE